jgi:predicted acyl esterase
MTQTEQVHVTDGMIIEWDVPIEMDDGLGLRADIFRPIGPGPYPVLLSHGPYAKGASFQTGYAATWNRLAGDYPEVTRNTTNKYQAQSLWVAYFEPQPLLARLQTAHLRRGTRRRPELTALRM